MAMDFQELIKQKGLPKDESPENWHQHTNLLPDGTQETGGWVKNTANVDPTVIIGPDAVVSGGNVRDNVLLRDNAHIRGGTASGNAIFSRNSSMTGGNVQDRAIITDRASVDGGSVGGNARLQGNGVTYFGTELNRNAVVELPLQPRAGTISSDQTSLGRYGYQYPQDAQDFQRSEQQNRLQREARTSYLQEARVRAAAEAAAKPPEPALQTSVRTIGADGENLYNLDKPQSFISADIRHPESAVTQINEHGYYQSALDGSGKSTMQVSSIVRAPGKEEAVAQALKDQGIKTTIRSENYTNGLQIPKGQEEAAEQVLKREGISFNRNYGSDVVTVGRVTPDEVAKQLNDNGIKAKLSNGYGYDSKSLEISATDLPAARKFMDERGITSSPSSARDGEVTIRNVGQTDNVARATNALKKNGIELKAGVTERYIEAEAPADKVAGVFKDKGLMPPTIADDLAKQAETVHPGQQAINEQLDAAEKVRLAEMHAEQIRNAAQKAAEAEHDRLMMAGRPPVQPQQFSIPDHPVNSTFEKAVTLNMNTQTAFEQLPPGGTLKVQSAGRGSDSFISDNLKPNTPTMTLTKSADGKSATASLTNAQGNEVMAVKGSLEKDGKITEFRTTGSRGNDGSLDPSLKARVPNETNINAARESIGPALQGENFGEKMAAHAVQYGEYTSANDFSKRSIATQNTGEQVVQQAGFRGNSASAQEQMQKLMAEQQARQAEFGGSKGNSAQLSTPQQQQQFLNTQDADRLKAQQAQGAQVAEKKAPGTPKQAPIETTSKAPAAPTVDSTAKIPVNATPEVPKVPEAPTITEAPLAGAAHEGSSLGNFMKGAGKVVGPAALVAPTAIEGFQGGYQAYKDGKGTGEIAGATAVGMGKGAVDTVAPGARDGYSDVIGKKDLTWADRALNATDHASATTAAVGGIAMAGEAAAVVTLPAEFPTAIATGVAGAVNVTANVAKAGLKATGLSGKDQDGGYIYNALSQEEQLKTHYSTDELQSQLKSGKGLLYDSFAKQYGEEFDTRQNSPDHGGMTALPKGLSRDQFIKNRIDFAAHEHAGFFGGSATVVERIAPAAPAPDIQIPKAPAPEINHSMASVADTHPMATLVNKDDHAAARDAVTGVQKDATQPTVPTPVVAVAQNKQQALGG